MAIGKTIRALRENLGISQVDLAKRIGVSKELLYRYETEKITNIPADRIERIANSLMVTPEYLMGWVKTPDKHLNDVTVSFKDKDTADRWRLMATAFAQLDEEDQQTIARNIDFLLADEKYKKVKNEVG